MAVPALVASDPKDCSNLERVTLVGVSHRTADLETRSALSLTSEKAEQVRERLRELGARSVLILSTCNRTEIYSDLGVEAVLGGVREFAAHGGAVYVKQGQSAAEHLCRVVCGLESAALGETEILAQAKLAWREACSAKAMSGTLDLLCRHSITVSKRVRSETELCRNVTSLASMAVRQAASVAGRLHGKEVVLLGAGAIAERLAKELGTTTARCTVVNRTLSKATLLAGRYQYRAAPLTDIQRVVGQADAVFAAVSCDRPLVSQSLAGPRLRVVVDLGVPSVTGPMPERVRVIDMEALTKACAANVERRSGAVKHAERIIDEELREFVNECAEREAAPEIQRVVELGDRVRREHLHWALANLDGLSDGQRKIVEDLAFRITRGVLQAPIDLLKAQRGRD